MFEEVANDLKGRTTELASFLQVVRIGDLICRYVAANSLYELHRRGAAGYIYRQELDPTHFTAREKNKVNTLTKPPKHTLMEFEGVDEFAEVATDLASRVLGRELIVPMLKENGPVITIQATAKALGENFIMTQGPGRGPVDTGQNHVDQNPFTLLVPLSQYGQHFAGGHLVAANDIEDQDPTSLIMPGLNTRYAPRLGDLVIFEGKDRLHGVERLLRGVRIMLVINTYTKDNPEPTDGRVTDYLYEEVRPIDE